MPQRNSTWELQQLGLGGREGGAFRDRVLGVGRGHGALQNIPNSALGSWQNPVNPAETPAEPGVSPGGGGREFPQMSSIAGGAAFQSWNSSAPRAGKDGGGV